jgi:eukaryotic-like serine/threonine-protein kinase
LSEGQDSIDDEWELGDGGGAEAASGTSPSQLASAGHQLTEQSRPARMSVKIPAIGRGDIEPIEREPSVQISMGGTEQSVVRPPPRRYETAAPFTEDHWTPGISPSGHTIPPPFLGVPQAPQLPDVPPPTAQTADVARGSTDIPVIADPPATVRGSTDIPLIADQIDDAQTEAMPPLEHPDLAPLASGSAPDPALGADIPPLVVTIEADDAPPRRLGNYEILQLIGSGGMAEVFLARHVGPMGFEKIVVLKCIHSHLAGEQQFVTMFLDEARLAARINDPRVVQIYELGKADDTLFMAMEYLEGESLSTIVKHAIRQKRPLAVGHVARIVADAAAGLHAAHELKDKSGRPLEVVHRDVSHGNIVVLYSGAVKVLDFGVAKARSSLSQTTAGERKGKFGYMSPEQVLGEPIDRRSDVFSLGVVLWEALTRKSLFLADTDNHAMRAILEGVVPPPSGFRGDVPPELDAIVLRALHKDRRHRYQSAADMAAALEGFLRSYGTNAHDLAAFMKETFADRIEQRTRLLRVATAENTPLERIELHHTETRVVAADRALDKLEKLQRRTRRRVIAAAVVAPILLGVAFYLGRRPSAEEPAPVPNTVQTTPAQPVAQPRVEDAAQRTLAQSLLERADIAIRNGRVASPPGDNALEFLLDAEKLEPGSARAKSVRAAAITQLLGSAEQLWNAGKLDSARTLYADALLFDPTIEIAKTRSKGVATAARTGKLPAASSATGGSKDVAWLVAEIDLAIIERRLVAPAGRNALELLQQLRRVDPTNETVRRLGGEITNAIVSEARTKPNDARLQAAAKSIAAKPAAVPAPAPTEPPKPIETEKPRDPELARQLVAKGNSLLGGGRLGDARAEFERAVAADSTAHSALAGLAEVAYNESDYTRAVLSAKRAIALAPSHGSYRMLLGKAYYKLLRYEDAIVQWKKAIELDPSNTAAQKNIEMAQRRMGG